MSETWTILLVDDDPDFVEGKRLYLEARGHRVLTAASASEALAVLEEVTPDAIVLDLMMDHVDDGFRLGYRIGSDERLRDVPRIMVSGVAAATGRRFDGDGEGLARWSRIDRFLDKPVSGAQLLRAIEEELAARRAAADT